MSPDESNYKATETVTLTPYEVQMIMTMAEYYVDCEAEAHELGCIQSVLNKMKGCKQPAFS
jgi:hypothetical protein